MNSAAQFAIELDQVANEVTDDLVFAMVQKLSLMALSRMVIRSPVDTGRFRGAWTVNLSAAGQSAGRALDPSGSTALSEGQGIISQIRDFDPVFITNNLPYANRLEGGWSTQAPGGMVALAFSELESFS